MRTWFCTYGAAEEISSDGGTLFESQGYNTFLKNWGIFNNTDNCGRLCQERPAWALLTHRNTPVQDLDMGPAVMLYGRIIKDHLLVLRDKYQTWKQWKEIGKLRELTMAKRHMRNKQFYNQRCHPLQELQVGDSV